MNRAIAVVVVADRAIKFVILQDAIKGLFLSRYGSFALRNNRHSRSYWCGAGTNELPVRFDQAAITSFDGSHLRVITHLRKRASRAATIHHFHKQFAGSSRDFIAIRSEE